MKQIYYAALALFTLAPTQAATTFMILDEYNSAGVPTGTSYENLTYYDKYVDAGSVDNSPFVIEKTTNYNGGILFFGNTELISEGDANTFRLTASNGSTFDFNSFDYYLEAINPNPNPDLNPDPDPTHNIISGPGYTSTPPTLIIRSSIGEVYDISEGGGSANPNWTDVEWVDFTSQYTKAHISNLSLSISAVPEVTSSFTMLGLISSGLMLRRRTKTMR